MKAWDCSPIRTAALAGIPEAVTDQRMFGLRAAKAIPEQARAAGFAGVVLMGLKFETAVGEAHEVWPDQGVAPLARDEAT